MTNIANALKMPSRLWTRQEIMARPSPVPAASGIYAWYFRGLEHLVPLDGCNVSNGFALLYVGIAPKAPPHNGKPPSKQSLCTRIKRHMCGNASGSTLRLTLGCLLATELEIELRCVGSSRRIIFVEGEDRVSEWMAEKARVVWFELDSPWVHEPGLIADLRPPLNLKDNEGHPFHATLSRARRDAKARARGLPGL